MVHLFGDLATELLIIADGDEGLFLRYDEVEFLAPTYAGDYIEVYGEITKMGNTSRTMEFVAKKVVAARPDVSPSAADSLEEPIVVARAKGVCVTPRLLRESNFSPNLSTSTKHIHTLIPQMPSHRKAFVVFA